ncbi:MAG: hypothetical protein NT003_00200 [Candidatus Magasanikbacteria bacterium]|nr:hypothetical protein [Candidatus Magasanikbacteria bacterium]
MTAYLSAAPSNGSTEGSTPEFGGVGYFDGVPITALNHAIFEGRPNMTRLDHKRSTRYPDGLHTYPLDEHWDVQTGILGASSFAVLRCRGRAVYSTVYSCANLEDPRLELGRAPLWRSTEGPHREMFANALDVESRTPPRVTHSGSLNRGAEFEVGLWLEPVEHGSILIPNPFSGWTMIFGFGKHIDTHMKVGVQSAHVDFDNPTTIVQAKPLMEGHELCGIEVHSWHVYPEVRRVAREFTKIRIPLDMWDRPAVFA